MSEIKKIKCRVCGNEIELKKKIDIQELNGTC